MTVRGAVRVHSGYEVFATDNRALLTGGQVTVSAAAGPDHVELAVTDSGEGLAPDQVQRIFERFYRVDRARDRTSGGSGIGLAIARAMVEAHGGTIHAESAGLGRGATFRLRLPTD